MATTGVKISALPPAGALTGAEIFALVQSGVTRFTTLNDIGSKLITGAVGSANVSVEDFGAVGDGVTDDTAAINAAIVAVGTAKGGVLQLMHKHALAGTVVCNYSNVLVQGYGSDSPQGGQGAFEAGTIIQWLGADAGGPMFLFRTPEGSNSKRGGGGLKGVYIKCNASASAYADMALRIVSWWGGWFKDIFINEPKSCGMECDTNINQTGSAVTDTQRCLFEDIQIRLFNHDTAVGIRLKNSTGGTGTGNTCINWFNRVSTNVLHGLGWDIYDTDHNLFTDCGTFRAGGGTGTGIILRGQYAGMNGPARYNTFHQFGTFAPIICEGTDAPGVTGLASLYNHFPLLGNGGASLPIRGDGAIVDYGIDQGTDWFPRQAQAVIASNITGSDVGLAEINDHASTSSLILVHGSGGHATIMNGDRTAIWILNVNNTTKDVEFRTSIAAIDSGLNIEPGGQGGYKINQSLVLTKYRMYAQPNVAPANPATGWVFYCDSADGNKLKAKASTGTIVTLGTP